MRPDIFCGFPLSNWRQLRSCGAGERRARTLSALLILATLALPRLASASCNLIPAALNEFPSLTGSIASPITAPGKTIAIHLGACDASPGFEPIAADNQVVLRFEPPGAGADTDHAISSSVLVTDCAPAARCKTLSFVMPGDLHLLYPPDGLAGPARIIVRDASNAVVAEIGELYLPTTGCDRTPEQVFHQFTVLPPANNFADAAAGTTTQLLATLDGGGNLLVPFDYWGEGVKSVLAEDPGSPVARILDGSMTLDAFSAAPGVPITAPSSDYIRSFTLDGRPLPPLLRSSAAGDLLFGSADASESVLRIARSMGGPDIYDLTDRLSAAGRGPILITSFDVSVRTKAPLRGLRAGTEIVAFARDEGEEGDINLDGDTADRVVEIIDGQTGAQTNTGAAVVESQTASFLIPALDTEATAVAFLEMHPLFDSYDVPSNASNVLGRLHVRLADGTLKTGATFDGDPAPRIDGQPLRLSDGLVFTLQRKPSLGLKFRSSQNVSGYTLGAGISRGGNHYYGVRFLPASVAVFERDLATGSFTLIQELFNNAGGVYGIAEASGLGITFDNRSVYVAGRADDGLAVFARDDVTGLLTFVEAHIDGVAGVDGLDGARFPFSSADGKSVYVCGSDDGKLAVFQRDAGTGSLTFLEAHAEPGLAHCSTAIPTSDGQFVYVAAGLGSPVHGAVSVYSRDPVTGALTFVESHFDDSAGGLIDTLGEAASAIVSADGKSLYVAGLGDSAITTFSRNELTGQITYVDALVDGVGGVQGIGNVNGVFPDPDNLHAYAPGLADNTLNVFDRDPITGLLTIAEQYVEGVNGISGLLHPTFGAFEPSFRELIVSGDAVGTATVFRVPAVLRVFDAAAGALRVFPDAPATTVSVAAGRAILLTPESDDLSVSNGDADRSDDIARIYDGPTNTLTSLALASRSIAISSELAAVTNPETGTLHVYPFVGGSVPPPAVTNADDGPIGTADTNVVFTVGGTAARSLRIYEHATPAVHDPKRRVTEFVVGSALVAFRTPESASGDLNHDGDTDDAVMEIYDFASRTVISTGQAATLCTFGGCNPFLPYTVRGNTVSFVTHEQDQGGRDLNGDGDSADTVMQVFDATSRVLYVVDLSGGSPDLSPFPDQYGDGTISYVQASEAALGIDVNDDGSLDDTVVLLAADSDDDGAFDDADLCRENPTEAGRDTDLDGLGDGCDPNPVCNAFTPLAPVLAPAEAECQTAIGAAVAKYVNLRGKAGRKCLDSLANGKLAGEPSALCLGGAAAGAPTSPAEAKTAAKIAKAHAKLSAAITGACGGAIPPLVDTCGANANETAACTAATAAAAAATAMRQAYGTLGSSTPVPALKCQKAVGGATVKYLATAVKVVTACLNAVADGTLVGDPRALCLGSLQTNGTVDLPGNGPTADSLASAAAKLEAAIVKSCAGGELASLDACGTTPPDAAECLACTAWRHAMEVVRAVYGPQQP